MVVPFLIFWGSCYAGFIMTVLSYIPTHSAQGLPFLYILPNTCLFPSWWWPFLQMWFLFCVSLISVVKHNLIYSDWVCFGKYGVCRVEQSFRACISFPWLLWQIITKSGALNNRNWFSSSSGDQKYEVSIDGPKSRYWQGYSPSRGWGDNLVLAALFLMVAGIPWFVATSLCSLPPWSHCLCLFCLDQIPHCLILIKTLQLDLESFQIIQGDSPTSDC